MLRKILIRCRIRPTLDASLIDTKDQIAYHSEALSGCVWSHSISVGGWIRGIKPSATPKGFSISAPRSVGTDGRDNRLASLLVVRLLGQQLKAAAWVHIVRAREARAGPVDSLTSPGGDGVYQGPASDGDELRQCADSVISRQGMLSPFVRAQNLGNLSLNHG